MRRWLGVLLACLLPVSVQAADAKATSQLQQSLTKLAAHDGFQCSFEQQIIYKEGGEQRYGGEIDVSRPGRFRWHYDTPYEQLYVGDGKVIWHYEPDLMQAERMDGLDAVDPVVMRLLDGRIRPGDVVLLAFEGREGSVGRYHVRLGERDFRLGLDGAGTLAYIESNDALGNRNRISLTGCTYIAPPAKHFSFQPPVGVDVVDVRSGAER